MSAGIVPASLYKVSAYNCVTNTYGSSSGSAGTYVAGNTYAYYVRIPAGRTVTITKLACQGSGTGAGDFKVRLGLYECDNDWNTSSLLKDAGTVINSTPVATGTMIDSSVGAFTAIQLGPAKNYAFAVQVDTVRTVGAGFTSPAAVWWQPPIGFPTATGSTTPAQFRAVNTATGSMPASFAYPDTLSAARPPLVFMYVSAVS